MQYAQIVLPLNLKGSFTYKVPEEMMSEIQPGMRVLVPFGGKKIYTGLVFELHDNAPENFAAKEVISMLDDKPILPEEQIRFWNWLSEYYLCSLGEIYRFSFPSSLKLESETYLKLKPGVVVDFENLDVNEMYLIQALEVRQLINLTDIEAFIPKKDIIRTINSLIDLQYIEIDEKIAEKYKAKEVAYVRIKDEVLANQNLTDILLKLNRAQKQKDLFLLILEKQTENPDAHIKKSELFEDGYFGSSHFKPLADKGLVEEYYMQKDRIESYEGEIEELEELSEQQKIAKSEIDEAFEEGKNVLLHGVTSSGKTHIYLEKIEECIKEGKNVLFLLPEISLTKQITQRLEKKYGRQLGFYHQKLTDFERVEVWRRIKQNDIRILIGTRNALFLPYQNLGLIVVDEEHDSAYRPREVTPYFNAKDASLVLGGFYNAGVILGSATPSVESYYRARKDKMKYIFLNERFGNVNLPEYELINFKEALESKKVSGNFSLKLVEEIKKTLDEKKQAIVLHNRRGYSNVIECESCGYVNYCSNCDVVMTYHKAANEMKCHYCGQRASKPRTCPKCNSEKLNERGVGVEQIHEEVSKLFPENEVDRMDVDSMRKKFAYEKLYEKIEDGETDIIVGTQMISKGLDFDHIELVTIPKADSLLYVQDFRAEERAYQLITQVSGRAGRVSGKGKILIQTFNPDHSVFQLIKMNNPSKIYKYILTERQKFHYPPFTKLIMIEMKHRKEDKVDRASQFLGSILRKYLPEDCVLGPERAQIARLNNLYQFQIMLKLPRGKNYEKFKSLVLISLKEFDEITAYQSIKKDVFVDF
ncbi:primosomal protein N' (replication factor Y) [Chryseobacterium sediminis]|uniref:Replication restart protein PriA n=1 Tax=Chryseobacterium sediminis TaxID=1679494 RepID=A0ABR6PUP2_9FLAO|nr:primosomal protein N' [Chryseobacterium sediminis]MBB6329420.1 primosomal protein N' (replication factor Y) [Chryseobacterium sediminis]